MPRTLSEKQKKAMQAGRERKAAERRAGAAARVKAYRAWARRDAEITRARLAGNTLPREPMPDLANDVTDDDFETVRGAAAA